MKRSKSRVKRSKRSNRSRVKRSQRIKKRKSKSRRQIKKRTKIMKGGVTPAGKKLLESMSKRGSVSATEEELREFQEAPRKGGVFAKSYELLFSKICSNDPIFIGETIPFKSGDHIKCARCDTDIDYRREEKNVIVCPNCNTNLTRVENNTLDLLHECEILPLHWKCIPAFWQKGTNLSIKGERTYDIPQKYKNNEYYFLNEETGETYWELP